MRARQPVHFTIANVRDGRQTELRCADPCHLPSRSTYITISIQELTPEHRHVLDRFPPALKALVEAELAAGNSILVVGAGHPAPPAGDMIKLAMDILTRATDAKDGLHAYIRDTSTHHAEVSDEERFFWVLTEAHPPAPPSDMDALRRARTYEPVKVVEHVHLHGSVEMDYRGEMLIYHETDRQTDIIWTWSRGNHFYRSSLTH